MDRKRRVILGLLAATMAFAAVLGSAASLGGITSTSLGADDAVVASCDTNGVTSSYTTAYNTSGTAGYKVDDVTIAGIADLCNGLQMKVTLVGTGNAALAEVTATVAVNSGASDTSDVVDFLSSNTRAEDVLGIHIVISG